MGDGDRGGRKGRFAVLRFSLRVEYHATEERARRRLSELNRFERVALVDRETGYTKCRRDQQEMVMEKLLRAGTAPADFARTGSVGDYLKTGPRKARKETK